MVSFDPDLILDALDAARDALLAHLEAAGLDPDDIQVATNLAESVRSAVADALDGGLQPDEAIEYIAAVVDLALPMQALLPGILGEVAEEYDGPAVVALLQLIRGALSADPAKLRERAAELLALGEDLDHPKRAARAHNRALRKLARANKIEAREQ